MVGGKVCYTRNFWSSHDEKQDELVPVYASHQFMKNFLILFWTPSYQQWQHGKSICCPSAHIIPSSTFCFHRSTKLIIGECRHLPWHQPKKYLQSYCPAPSFPLMICVQASRCPHFKNWIFLRQPLSLLVKIHNCCILRHVATSLMPDSNSFLSLFWIEQLGFPKTEFTRICAGMMLKVCRPNGNGCATKKEVCP